MIAATQFEIASNKVHELVDAMGRTAIHHVRNMQLDAQEDLRMQTSFEIRSIAQKRRWHAYDRIGRAVQAPYSDSIFDDMECEFAPVFWGVAIIAIVLLLIVQ
jgi:hypothetical protein